MKTKIKKIAVQGRQIGIMLNTKDDDFITTTFNPKTKTDWKNWLQKHHQTATEIWVILYKKSSGKQTVVFQDLLDEALCFGWIDNLEKGIDSETYAVRFTPRKKKSNWSEINKKRYHELQELGLITAAGKKAYEN